MTPKQDKTYTRTASDLERKYGFGKTFAEILGIAEDAQDAAEEAKKNVTELDENLTQDEIFNRLTKNGEVKGIYRDAEGNIYINADYLVTGVIRSKDGTSVVIDLDNGEGTFTGSFQTVSEGSGTFLKRANMIPGSVTTVATNMETGEEISKAYIHHGGCVTESSAGSTAITPADSDPYFDNGGFSHIEDGVGMAYMGTVREKTNEGAKAHAILRNYVDGTRLDLLLQSGRVKISGLTAPVDTSDATNKAYVDGLIDRIYPVGAIYMSMSSTSPNDLFGGTWERILGRFLLAAHDGGGYYGGTVGGEATHTLTQAEMPAHYHTSNGVAFLNPSQDAANAYTAMRGTNYTNLTPGGGELPETGNAGGGQPHNNMPPYLAVYMWKRIA